MPIAYFDCFSGAAGDMIVAALIHAGADSDELRNQLDALGLDGYELTIESVRKQGFDAVRFGVKLNDGARKTHRHLKHLVEIIHAARLSDQLKDQAIRIFTRLAEAEARVHGTTIEKVHFHEVGAVDAILDVVGAVTALNLLGVDRVVCSPIPVGSGTVSCEHGAMPVPAPATAELLKGIPIALSVETGELTTPTGAAVLTTLAAEFGAIPAMKIERVGYGAGTRDGAHVPNLLRVLIGEGVSAGDAETDEIVVLETNLDDATSQQIGHCLDRLMSEGVLDAYVMPIQMKKSRPGFLLSVLCEPGRVDEFERIIFAETPTFGIRRHRATRTKLTRRHESVETPFGTIRMKVGEGRGVVTATPEFEDCRSAAKAHRVTLRAVIDAAARAWRDLKRA
jgi:hypothetical protein